MSPLPSLLGNYSALRSSLHRDVPSDNHPGSISSPQTPFEQPLPFLPVTVTAGGGSQGTFCQCWICPSTTWVGAKAYGRGDAPSAKSSSPEDEASFPGLGDTCGFRDHDGQQDARNPARKMQSGVHHPFLIVPPPQNCPPHRASCCTLTFMGWQLRRSVRFEMLLLKSPMAGEGNIYLQLDIY